MLKNPVINTGDPRSVTGHMVSGAVACAIVSGAVNYKKFQDGDMEKSKAVRDTLKKSAQGGIATGAAISAANHLGSGNWFKALSAMSMGMASLYAVEIVDNQLEQLAQDSEQAIEGVATTDDTIGDDLIETSQAAAGEV